MDNLKSLKDFAKETGISYSTAYRKYKRGEIENTKIIKGDIYIEQPEHKSVILQNKADITKTVIATAGEESYNSRNNYRNNSVICQYKNIDTLFSPAGAIITPGQAANNSNIDPQDMIRLTQKAYYGLSAVRRIIDTLKDFSSSPVYLQGGSAKSRMFFENYFKYIGLNSFTEKFFLEFWRSSNCFIYKMNGKVKGQDLMTLKRVAGSFSKASSAQIPIKYIILNPVDIIFKGAAFFSYGKYYKVLNSYEIAKLANPQTPEDELVANSLPKEVKDQLKDYKKTNKTNILLELPASSVCAIFNGKTDYEPFAVSLIYPVLDDLEYKLEMKQMDRAIAKTCQQSVLHVAMGYEDKDGNYHFSEQAAKKVEEIYNAGSVGKVLITDFTAKLQFAIPQIGELLDPKKYEVVNKDIQDGLMDILAGGESGEKFSNLTVKVKVFIERIRKAREIFLNEFLIPEMESIAEEVGIKQVPIPKFEDIDIEDNLNFYKVITRLAEIGLLTPEEVFEAFETGRLPTGEESLESQKNYKQHKDDELYKPLIGGQKEDPNAAGGKGRPAGTPAPRKPSPQGMASVNAEKVIEVLKADIDFKHQIATHLKKTHKIKTLTKEQNDFVNEIGNRIIINESKDSWNTSLSKYLSGDVKDSEQAGKISELAKELNLTPSAAALIYHSNAN
ncbi:MAG: hypothetical protein EKK57_10175 [Proteobacteria bacterium]|nr:MAG: hypothetical protein EKK57_10175 [Pseudomonadota bacterium]